MKRVALVVVTLVGCGDDGGNTNMVDTNLMPGPDYDLSCLNNMITAVPTTISLGGEILDLTNFTTPVPKAPMASITARTITDNAMVGMATADADGKVTLDITTTGTAARIDYEMTATGFVKTHNFVSVAPFMTSTEAFWFMSKQSRLDSLATALGVALDPAKGVLEVWANDCSKGELPQATLQLDGADVSWAMYGGVGVWIPREQTLQKIQNIGVGSIAGTVNVTPGTHTITIHSGALTLSSTVTVEANAWHVLAVYPGHPL